MQEVWDSRQGAGQRKQEAPVAWTKNPNLGIYVSLMVANDVSLPRECFDKISEFMKRNWQRIFSLQLDL